MAVPKCTSWLGHKFEGRYSSEPIGNIKLGSIKASGSEAATYLEAVGKLYRRTTYERDVCIRCGHVLERTLPASTEAAVNAMKESA